MDWERFEAEFADLDAELDTGSPLADRILAAVRARRTRRRVLAVVAGAMSAAGLVVSVLLVVLPGRAPTGPGAAGPGIATRAHIYAAALSGELHGAAAPSRAALHGAAGAGGAGALQPARQQIRVSARVCRAAVPSSSTASPCVGGHIPRAVLRQVSALLGLRVVFSATPPAPGADALVVQFGRLVVRGAHAALGIRTCAPLCGQWQTVRLREKAGHWHGSGSP